MSNIEHLIEQHVREYESRLRHIDELYQRAHTAVADKAEAAHEDLQQLTAQRALLHETTRQMRAAPTDRWQRESHCAFDEACVFDDALGVSQCAPRDCNGQPCTLFHLEVIAEDDQQALVFQDIDVTEHKGLLSPAGNLLAIHGLNFGAGSSDFLIVPELRGESLGGGDTITLSETTKVRARAFCLRRRPWRDGCRHERLGGRG